MKQITLMLALFLILGSCGSETDIDNEKEQPKGPLEVIMNNKAYDYHPKDVEAYITSQNEIRIFITYEELHTPNNPIISFGMGFIFKENNLYKVETTFAGDGKNYRTADFIPANDLQIRNYSYNPTTRDLYFEFEGKLFEILSDANPSGGNINLKGKVDQKQIELRVENKGTQPIAKFNVGANSFYPVIYFSARSEESDHIFHHSFISNKGDRIRFAFDPFILNVPVLPITFSFDRESTTNRIDFYEFNSFSRSTMGMVIREEDWKKYNCSGSITVTEKFNEGSGSFTKGTFSLEVYDNEQHYLTTENGTFVIKQ